jgi:hypothetical protein
MESERRKEKLLAGTTERSSLIEQNWSSAAFSS